MESIIICLFIILISSFGINFTIAILSYLFDWNIEEECEAFCIISLVLLFVVAGIAAVLYDKPQ